MKKRQYKTKIFIFLKKILSLKTFLIFILSIQGNSTILNCSLKTVSQTDDPLSLFNKILFEKITQRF